MVKIPSSPPFAGEHLSTGLLIQTVQSVSAAQTIEQITALVKQAARRGVGADGVTIVLREGERCFYADEDAIAPLWKGKRFPMNACVSGWAMHHRMPVVIPDITEDVRVPQDAYRPTFVRSLVMVPIRSADPIGAIGAYWQQVQTATPETVHWLQALADATSAGLEAVRANAEVAAVRSPGGSRPPMPNEFVRMCSWTKRLYHEGKWISLEAFLRQRFGLEVTHGMSEDALSRLAREMDAVAARPPLSKPG
jgi:hypothetical protein